MSTSFSFKTTQGQRMVLGEVKVISFQHATVTSLVPSHYFLFIC